MYTRSCMILSILFLLTAPVAAGKKVGGKSLPDTMTVGGQELVFNGAGLRKKLFIKVYAGALYLKAKSKDREAVMAADEPMAIRMHFIYSKVDQDKLVGAWNEGFDLVLGADKGKHQSHIDAFNALFSKAAKADEVYDIIYEPGKGIDVQINGSSVGVVDGGPEFKKAVFGIWLHKKSAVADLGKAMMKGK